MKRAYKVKWVPVEKGTVKLSETGRRFKVLLADNLADLFKRLMAPNEIFSPDTQEGELHIAPLGEVS